MGSAEVEIFRRTKASLIDIYDFYRVCLLNEKYYGQRLHRYSFLGRVVDVMLAIGTTGSGVAGWQLWDTTWGKYVWGAIAGLASLVALIKPVLEIGKKIETYTKLYYGHHINSIKLENIVSRIRIEKCFSEPMRAECEELRRTFADLAALDDYRPSEKTLLALMREVEAEVPVESLWMPSRPK